MRPSSIVVLVSGNGSNLQSIIDHVRDGRIKTKIAAVISDNDTAYAIVRARHAGIRTMVVRRNSHETRQLWESVLTETVADLNPSLVVLAGFMHVLGKGFIRRFDRRIMNIHPSLLPAYKGLNTHQRVIDAGERTHGATVHFVTRELDDGPIVLQAGIPVSPEDTVHSLSRKVLDLEHAIYPEAIRQFIEGCISFDRPQCP